MTGNFGGHPVPEDKPLTLDGMIKQYQEDSAAWFPDVTQSLAFRTLCVAGEVGEVANLIKKVERGTLRMEDAMETLPEEIVDTLIYLTGLMAHAAFKDIDWKVIWDNKRMYNEMRFGDNR